MREVGPFRVFDRSEEILNPSHTALLVIDMQNDFVSPGGHFDRYGKNVSAMTALVPQMGEFIEQARLANVSPIFIQQYTLPNGRSDSPAWAAFKTRDGKSPDYATPGTWGHAFIDGIGYKQGDLRVDKPRPSAFLHTPLDLILRSMEIKTIVVIGVTTEGCVESTVRDGSYHGYYVVIVDNLVASSNLDLHEGSLRLMRSRYLVLGSKGIGRIWEVARHSEPMR